LHGLQNVSLYRCYVPFGYLYGVSQRDDQAQDLWHCLGRCQTSGTCPSHVLDPCGRLWTQRQGERDPACRGIEAGSQFGQFSLSRSCRNSAEINVTLKQLIFKTVFSSYAKVRTRSMPPVSVPRQKMPTRFLARAVRICGTTGCQDCGGDSMY
jgi:hypothetical protein